MSTAKAELKALTGVGSSRVLSIVLISAGCRDPRLFARNWVLALPIPFRFLPSVDAPQKRKWLRKIRGELSRIHVIEKPNQGS